LAAYAKRVARHGEIATPMTGAHERDPHTIQRPRIPAPGDAREVAAAIAFLASPEAAYVTGASSVDGDWW
jgi:NAD(P)-dependent dehydrogenase (short-subunit alcohol dehydrogenase family)